MILKSKRPVALIILDGWGVSPHREGNAVALARTPFYDEIRESFPFTTLTASGPPPDGPGNAEIGHRTLGAGRIVRTDSALVAEAAATGELTNNQTLVSALARAAAEGRRVHLIGLLGDGGVHSHPETLFAILRSAKRAGVRDAFVHGILDGRDVPARTADVYVDALEIKMCDIGLGKIASLCGRFYAMDMTENWARTARAYTMLVHGEGERLPDAASAIRASFLRGISDEFIAPIVIENTAADPVATVREGDLVIFFNHRGDGMRQLVRSLAVPDGASPTSRIEAVCLTEYDAAFGLPVAFQPIRGGNFLSEVLEREEIRSYRISETARSLHVTNYFNGHDGGETDLERRAFLQTEGRERLESGPESRSFKIADTVIRGINSGAHGLFIINLPAAAMAAATGDLERTVESIQFVDTCLGGILQSVRDAGGAAVVTASHTGCERMNGLSGDPGLAPLHIFDPASGRYDLASGGSLADVAPTILGLLDIEVPAEMTGRNLRAA